MSYVIAFTPCVIMLLVVCYFAFTAIKTARTCRHKLVSDVVCDIYHDEDYLHIVDLKVYCEDCGEVVYQVTDRDLTAGDYDPIAEAKEILK